MRLGIQKKRVGGDVLGKLENVEVSVSINFKFIL